MGILSDRNKKIKRLLKDPEFCMLDSETLMDFLSGRLSETKTGYVKRHIENCRMCREVLGTYMKAVSEDLGEDVSTMYPHVADLIPGDAHPDAQCGNKSGGISGIFRDFFSVFHYRRKLAAALGGILILVVLIYRDTEMPFEEFIEYNPAPLPTMIVLRCPGSAPDAFDIGMEFYENRKWEKAVPNLEKAVRQKPSAAGRHFYLGETYRMLHEYDKAIDSLQKAVESDDDEARYRYYLAMAALQAGKYDLAVRELRVVIELNDEHVKDAEDLLQEIKQKLRR